jgi:mannose-6-phosphate isomerase-like protein (cupin superfamily)
VPVGVPHAWRDDDGRAVWIDMAAPQPRRPGIGQTDTFFLGDVPSAPPSPLDVRDPRNRNLFRLDDWQMDLDELKLGAAVDQPTVSASMATALLAYSGIAVKMLVDQRLDAHLHTMFMVQYQATGMALPHDHPFEESYYMLEGEVDVVADDVRYTLRPGDAFWTGVGCIHAFYNKLGNRVRWLETSAPGPPDRHSYRFNRDWEYLVARLEAEQNLDKTRT